MNHLEEKIVTAGVGLVIGYAVDAALAAVLVKLGLPKHTAKVVGTVIGALI